MKHVEFFLFGAIALCGIGSLRDFLDWFIKSLEKAPDGPAVIACLMMALALSYTLGLLIHFFSIQYAKFISKYGTFFIWRN